MQMTLIVQNSYIKYFHDVTVPDNSCNILDDSSWYSAKVIKISLNSCLNFTVGAIKRQVLLLAKMRQLCVHSSSPWFTIVLPIPIIN